MLPPVALLFIICYHMVHYMIAIWSEYLIENLFFFIFQFAFLNNFEQFVFHLN